MPEYLAPGVYVEETSFRSKSIEGVSTTTTGFIGPARFGPITLSSGADLLTSLGDFLRIYGDGQQLQFEPDEVPSHNQLWHAVRAFFIEGGKRLYIARVFKPRAGEYPPVAFADADPAAGDDKRYDDGHARASLPISNATGAEALQIRARFPGSVGNMRVTFTLVPGQNILSTEPASSLTSPASPGQVPKSRVGALFDNDLVWIGDLASPIASPPGSGSFYVASYHHDTQNWHFQGASGPDLTLDDISPLFGDQVRVVTLTVTVTSVGTSGPSQVWSGIPLDPNHTTAGTPDSLFDRFAQHLGNEALERSLPIVIARKPGGNIASALNVLGALFTAKSDLHEQLNNFASNDRKKRLLSTDTARSVDVLLRGGNDGLPPSAAEYEGTADEDQNYKTGLKIFEDLDDISIVAAPGSTYGYENGNEEYRGSVETIVDLLIAHATLMRYRIAVLDSGNGQSISQVRAFRAKIDSTYAALYYPWIRIFDPITGKEIYLPPSGFVAGIYARNDTNRGVYKAPANEVVNLAIGFEQLLNKGQQEVLNPEGIDCFRFFEDRGFRLWGARTVSSDPEWKYVSLRRYFAYLEHSIDKGTQWVVFEPNGPTLWGNVRRTIEDFLLSEWQSGALLGTRPEQAFFVRCDLSTMNQNDLDNGRLVCLIGVAPVRPAEFVIFRIGQWTGDRKP